MEVEISRSFLDWNCDAVCHWLSNLSLSNDYSSLFKDRLITGSTLVSLSREELEEMGIVDGADRLKILQQITSMKADLVTSGRASPTKRNHPKRRQFYIETKVPSQHSGGVRRTSQGRWSPRDGLRGNTHHGMERTSNPMVAKYINLSIQERSSRTPDLATSIMNSPCHLSADQTSSDSRDSSRMSSPDKPQCTEVADGSHDVSDGSNTDVSRFSKLQTFATLRGHNVKRLSRSLNHLFQEGEDIFSLYQKTLQGDESNEYPSSCRLVEILREENTSLKQELETYYQRVRKLQRIEQEVEHIREAHRVLEAGTMRREGLEKALRSKLEQEVRRLKEESISLRAEMSMARRENNGNNAPAEKKTPNKREIRRRDTMITRLIRQNKDAALERERLEKDLQLARAQLQLQVQENKRTSEKNGELGTISASNGLESNNEITQVYSESIEKLRGVLGAMQTMSQKREKLEKKLRSQLEGEIHRLKKELPNQAGEEIDIVDSLAELEIQNTSLAADGVKWEQKCMELVAEKQMAFEAAVIPKNARIASLERSLAEKIDMLHEVQHQKAAYIGQLTDAKRQMSELEIRLTSAHSSLQEKDSVIQMMQTSFLEPEEDGSSLTPPQNCPFPKGSQRSSEKLPCQITEVTPMSSSSQSSTKSTPTNPQYNITPRTPQNPVRQPSLASPVRQSSNHRSQSASPVKALGSNGLKPRGSVSGYQLTNGFSSGEPPAPNKRNGYTTHSLCSGGRYSSSSTTHHHSNIHSNSAPNSPNVRNTTHKPRITHSNLRVLQVPGAVERPGPTLWQNHAHTQRKSNTGSGGTRKSSYQRPLSPSVVKSKTPPPDYHLVSAGRSNSAPKVPPKKQRHKSVDNILGAEPEKSLSYLQNGSSAVQDSSYDLFCSLVGDTVPLNQSGGMSGVRSGFGGSMQVGIPENSNYDDHQHSKSSPPNEYTCIVANSEVINQL